MHLYGTVQCLESAVKGDHDRVADGFDFLAFSGNDGIPQQLEVNPREPLRLVVAQRIEQLR